MVNSWSEAMTHSSASTVSIATWNADALRTSLTQAIALEFDILALQEIRVDEATALGLRKQAKQQGYQLVWGTLPTVKVNGKKGLLNPQIPALVFLLKILLGLRKLVLKHSHDGKSRADVLQYKCSCSRNGSLVFQFMLQLKTLRHFFKILLTMPSVTPTRMSSLWGISIKTLEMVKQSMILVTITGALSQFGPRLILLHLKEKMLLLVLTP